MTKTQQGIEDQKENGAKEHSKRTLTKVRIQKRFALSSLLFSKAAEINSGMFKGFSS